MTYCVGETVPCVTYCETRRKLGPTRDLVMVESTIVPGGGFPTNARGEKQESTGVEQMERGEGGEREGRDGAWKNKMKTCVI